MDIRQTKSAKAADIFLQVRPGKDFELITILRALIKDQKISEEAVAEFLTAALEDENPQVFVAALGAVATADEPGRGGAGRADDPGAAVVHRADDCAGWWAASCVANGRCC